MFSRGSVKKIIFYFLMIYNFKYVNDYDNKFIYAKYILLNFEFIYTIHLTCNYYYYRTRKSCALFSLGSIFSSSTVCA